MILSLLASISWLSEYRINCVREDLSYRQLRSNTLTSPESVSPQCNQDTVCNSHIYNSGYHNALRHYDLVAAIQRAVAVIVVLQ